MRFAQLFPIIAVIAFSGLVDVIALHGRVGVSLSNALPWNATYECVAK